MVIIFTGMYDMTSPSSDPLYLIVTTLIALLIFQIVPWSKVQTKLQTKWRIYQSYQAQEILDKKIQIFSEGKKEELPTVSGIFVYPVKSLRAVSISKSKIDTLGLCHDRRFMIVRESPPSLYESTKTTKSTPTHRFFTQRQAPILATITASLIDKNSQIMILSHDDSNAHINVPTSEEYVVSRPIRYTAGIWDDNVEVADMGDEVAHFLQSIIKQDKTIDPNLFKNIRLVSLLPTTQRYTDSNYIPAIGYDRYSGTTPLVSLTDGFPILIASETSLNELNKRLEQNSQPFISMSRFRPNIVVRGVPKAFEEDEWKSIQIGNVWFHLTKACPRCKQSCTDQVTGARFEEPLKTMAEFRKLGGNGCADVYFAMNAIVGEAKHDGEQEIKVGDQVRVVTRGATIWGAEADPE